MLDTEVDTGAEGDEDDGEAESHDPGGERGALGSRWQRPSGRRCCMQDWRRGMWLHHRQWCGRHFCAVRTFLPGWSNITSALRANPAEHRLFPLYTNARVLQLQVMEFLHGPRTGSRRVALFPGAFNPPTVAHVEIARAALEWADEVVWVMARAMPHKGFEGADFAARCAMLCAVAEGDERFSAAVSEGGLFAEMAAEARESFGSGVEIGLVCGRDAAERVAGWEYERPGVFDDLLRQYRLLVADRTGDFQPAEQRRDRVTRLAVTSDVSSTEVRRLRQAGLPWKHLVPGSVLMTYTDLD